MKGINMTGPKQWAELINRSKPWFVEVKAYMFVGFSKKRMVFENMPRHPDIVEFANKIVKYSDYSSLTSMSEVGSCSLRKIMQKTGLSISESLKSLQ